MNTPWVESIFFEEELERRKLNNELKTIARDYHEKGYVVLRQVFDNELIEQVVRDMITEGNNALDPMYRFQDGKRLQDLWKHSDACRKLATEKKIIETLQTLYDRNPIPFQTLNFSEGSQQKAHSDSIHFSSMPARFMCGVWIALEDITPENGPVFYYSGSHKLPEFNFLHIREDASDTSELNYPEYEEFLSKVLDVKGYKKEYFCAKKGDVLIWSSNLIHGGEAIQKPGTTRYSQVTHYFFEDCLYYTPMYSNMVIQELFLKTELQNIITGEKLISSYNGNKLGKSESIPRKYILKNKSPREKLMKWVVFIGKEKILDRFKYHFNKVFSKD
ncbi:MAG: phytanoyl-CoA dioxygenase family protein [Cryomorphaceae bacterium]|nr:phytanoyl-CoA dioxygenase family protein [Cryomorphaceae bacterium]